MVEDTRLECWMGVIEPRSKERDHKQAVVCVLGDERNEPGRNSQLCIIEPGRRLTDRLRIPSQRELQSPPRRYHGSDCWSLCH